MKTSVAANRLRERKHSRLEDLFQTLLLSCQYSPLHATKTRMECFQLTTGRAVNEASKRFQPRSAILLRHNNETCGSLSS